MTSLRTVIVDDEEPARELLRALLSAWPDVEVVAEAGDGRAALETIERTAPDLVFLDIQMPGMNGLDVALALAGSPRAPAIVFVTAYDQYAVSAFEVSACDYLLKPFAADRLAAALDRARSRSRVPGAAPDATLVGALEALLTRVRPPSAAPVVVKTDGRHVFLRAEEIEWVEAVGKEIRVHIGASALVARESMSSIEGRLDPASFVRVHRSAIVNRGHVREMQPWFKGDYVVILKRGTRIVTGRTYRAAVHRLLDTSGGAPGKPPRPPAGQ